MAFLHASATNTRKPICTKVSSGRRTMAMPVTAAKRHMGMTRMPSSGGRRLSYLADSTKYTRSVLKACGVGPPLDASG